MKSHLKQIMAVWVSLALFLSSLLSALSIDTGTAKAAGAIPDNDYAVTYRYLKDGATDSSAANIYLSVPGSGKLIVKDGSLKFEHQITQKYYSYFKYIGFRKAGSAKAVINPDTQQITGLDGYQNYPVRASADGSGNWTTTIPMEDIVKKPDVLMHVVIKDDPEYPPGFVYDNWYNVQLEIDTSGLPGNNNAGNCVYAEQPITLPQLQDLITVSKSVYASTYEGTDYGNYPAGSKQPLYTNIVLADNFVAMGSTAPELVKAVFTSLTAALNTFQYEVVSKVDKSDLRSLVHTALKDQASMHEAGYVECKEGYNYPPVTPGEYTKGSKESTQLYLGKAQTVLLNVYATAANVTKAINQLKGYTSNEYVVSEPVKLIILDSLNPTSAPSQKAPEIAGTADLIQPRDNNSEYVRANLTFNGTAPSEVVQSTPEGWSQNNGAGFMKDGLDYANEANRALLLAKSSNAQKNVYQVLVRGAAVDNTKWEGRSYLRYKLNGITKEVYISYNGNQLDALNKVVGDTQKYVDSAVALPNAEQTYAAAKSALQAKLAAAKATTANLAAPRTQIEAASSGLAQALDDFKATSVISVPGPGDGPLADGVYPIGFHIYKKGTSEPSVMYDYVVASSGKLNVEGGNQYVSFTLKQNAEILSFKTERKGALVETDKISEDTAANTRVIRFPVSDLGARLNGWVKIYWILPPPINVYDHEYEVELAFDKPVIPEDQHELNFSVLHATKDEFSSMDKYFAKPGKYSVGSGKVKVTLTLKDSTIVPSFKVEQNGVLTETKVISTDTAANTRVVQFETADLTTLLNAQVHVSTSFNGQPYEMDHKIRLKLSPTDKTALNALIASAQSKFDAAVEGTEAGKYPATAKAALQAAIEAAKASALSATASQQAVDAAVSSLQKGIQVFHASIVLEEADYLITLPTAIKDSTGAPISNYVSSETKLKVSDGKQVATFNLKDGVILKKIQKKKADGALEDVLPQVAAAAKQKNEVAILSVSSFSFDVDRTTNYLLTLVGADQTDRVFEIAFAELEPTKVNPGTGGPGPVTPVNVHGISDGTYSISYKFLKYNASSTSVMQDYVVIPGKLTVSRSLMFFEFTLKNSKEIPDFQIDNGGGLSTPEVSSTDEKNNTRTYKFNVTNLDEKLHGWIDVNWPAMNYVHKYDVHLAFDRSSLKAIAGGAAPGAGEKPLATRYTAGEYVLEYAFNVRGSAKKAEVDVYMKHPAKFVVKDGKSYLQVTVANKEVKSLKIDNNGTLTEAEIVSTNAKDNEKTLQFPITDTDSKVMAQITTQGQYSGDYKVEFVWDSFSIKPYKEQPKEVDVVKPPVVAVNVFSDVEKHWAKALIERAIKLGLVSGYEDQTFRPDNRITRAEFAVLLSRVLKLEAGKEPLSFTDASDIPTWVKPQLTSIIKADIMNGYEDGTFRADRDISRAELAVIVTRALKLKVDANAKPSFADVESIPSWAQAEVAAAHEQGILSGRDNNVFAPNESATRAEAVSLILALYHE
ncbi:hypothetical protein BC351_24765 [Paenibacillus ferrarius]|uniref:S-layer protein n=1 Tax=Paenibacillus ferrarius TaxID=1469647 RepID=A0A1V4HL79_9BACL|nr:NEAT domain-containing protein [Paenibacillus ferrarius]OPH58154.1 hypothetical protein BC351_24765 [Paenibacillus ferrarius]